VNGLKKLEEAVAMIEEGIKAKGGTFKINNPVSQIVSS